MYVREAHPGDRYPQPHDLARKIEHARAYRDRDSIPWTIAVEARMSAMLRGVGMMQPTLEAAGPVALRDLRREAPPVYVFAQTASAFRALRPLGRSLAAAGTRLVSVAAAGLTIRAVARAMRRD